jgi:hypothetical protein
LSLYNRYVSLKMKYPILLFSIITFIGCSPEQLKIEDLKFYEYGKNSINAFKIKESVITYDTSLIDSILIKNKDINKATILKMCKEGYGTGIIKYDTNGNIVYDHVNEYMGTTQKFKYDTLQLLTEKIYDTDFQALYTIKYSFDGKNKTLYQFWTYGEVTDTTMLYFDKTGNLVKETGYLHDDKSRKRKYTKEYTSVNDTLKKILWTYIGDYENLVRKEEYIFRKKEILAKIEEFYYYSTKLNNNVPRLLKLNKEYDKRGLPEREIITYEGNDPIIKLITNK